MSLQQFFLLGWLLVLLPATLCGQQTTFIMHFDSVQNGRGGRALDIVETPTGYLVSGYQSSPGPFHRWHTFFRAIDHEGNVLSDQEYWYGDPRVIYPGSNSDHLVPVNDSTFVGVIDAGPWDSPYGGALYGARYDVSGDSLSMNELINTPVSDSIFYGVHQTTPSGSNGDVVYAGSIWQPPDPKLQGWLVRCDVAGDTLWTRKVGPPDHYITLSSIDRYPMNKEVIVCGDESYPGNQDDYLLFRADSSGSIIWRINFGGKAGGYPTVRVAPDSSLITWTSTADLPGYPNAYAKLNLRKWDANGDLVWSTYSETISDFLIPQNMEVLPDGSIICNPLYWSGAGLWKFSPQGDSLWMRSYRVFDGPGAGITVPYDVEPTSDGGFIFCGVSQQGNADPNPNMQTWFVVKTDSLGCVVPGCHLVGVEEYEIALQNALEIWPNPAAFRLQAELELPAGYPLSGAVTAQLLDLQGREVRRWPTELRGGRVSLSTTDLPAAGAYVLHLTDARRWLAGGKVVVEAP